MNEAYAAELWIIFVAIVFCGSAFTSRRLLAKVAFAAIGGLVAGFAIVYWSFIP